MSNPTIDNLGNKRWRNSKGEMHRLDGPAWEWAGGTKCWYVEGKLHRLDGPAREWADGDKEWWRDGQIHRLDGPAFECSDGYKSWWVAGVEVTEKDYPESVLLYKCRMVLES
jgi:hypothetical protein